MKRRLPLAVGALLLALATMSPVAAQDDTISVTPADGLRDGQSVEISATTTGSTYATLGLCPAASAPVVGAPVTDLLSTRHICVGLVCLHDGNTEAALVEAVGADCPLAVQPVPISSVSTTVALPRFTGDGTDCALADCVVVFNTWNAGSAQGAVSAPVSFQQADPVSTTTLLPTTTLSPATTLLPTTTLSATTTTVALSAPSVTSTSAPVSSTSVPSAAPTSTVATQVLGAQETNDGGELAVTGLDAGVLAALGAALLVVGGGALTGARRR